MGRLLFAFTGKKNRLAVVKSAAAVINKAAEELSEIQNDPRLNDRQKRNFAAFDDKIADLVAQIEALGQTEGLWPKGIYLNMKAEDLMKNVNAFAGEVEISSAALRLQFSHSAHSSYISVADDMKTPTKTTFNPGPMPNDSKSKIFDDGVLLSDVLAQTGGDVRRARATGGSDTISLLKEDDIVDATADIYDDDGDLDYVSSRSTSSSASQPESPASPSLYKLPALLGSVHSFGGTDHSGGYSLPLSPGELPTLGAVYDSADLLAWRQGREMI